MATPCDSPDIIYPLIADIFYPTISQGGYGNITKQWMLDRSVNCSFNPAGTKSKQNVSTDAVVTLDNVLVGRTKQDLLVSDRESENAMTNVILANIRDRNGNIIYNETAGVRKGKSTIFEIASITPIVGPFGKTEYYRVVIRRSENQAADV